MENKNINYYSSELLRKIEDVYHAIPNSEIEAAKTCRGVLLGMQLGIKMLANDYIRGKEINEKVD